MQQAFIHPAGTENGHVNRVPDVSTREVPHRTPPRTQRLRWPPPNRTMSLISKKMRVSTSSRSLPQKHFTVAWYNGGSDFNTTSCRMRFRKKKPSILEILHVKTGLMYYHPRHSVGREDGEQG